MKKGSEDKVASYIEEAAKFANETAPKDSDKIKAQVEAATVEKLGIPNAEIAVKNMGTSKYPYQKSNRCKNRY